MFVSLDTPRIFALPPGCDFAKEFVEGLLSRTDTSSPADLAKVEVYLSTRNLQRAVIAEFVARKNLLLPQLKLINDLSSDPRFPHIPLPVSDIQRRLELLQAVDRLLANDTRFASHLAKYDLTRSLESLLQELHQENVDPQRIRGLDLSDISEHWQQSLKFIEIIVEYWRHDQYPDRETRLGLVIEALIDSWAQEPPEHPVIIAGSTGSVGSTQDFMTAVANLPQGALVLPGFDNCLDALTWDNLDQPFPLPDHPQYRFRNLIRRLSLNPTDVPLWTASTIANHPRNPLISLALIPAPVTDQWMDKGPRLQDIHAATAGISLIEAPNRRQEAQTIALEMRRALHEHETVALVTSDRMLVRQVKLALRKWNIVPHDSSRGTSLVQSLEGRLLTMIATLMGKKASLEDMIALLKHPLAGSGDLHEEHVSLVHDMEYFVRSRGPEHDPIHQISDWAQESKIKHAKSWHVWFHGLFEGLSLLSEGTLNDLVGWHLSFAEQFVAGCWGEPVDNLLNDENQARLEVRELLQKIRNAAQDDLLFAPADYAELFLSLGAEIRTEHSESTHQSLRILTTENARMQTADIVIAASLNEGTWPILPGPDPWLNRNLRAQLGLNQPEMAIGLTAHDFQHVVSIPKVILSRSIRDADNPTTPSRWLSRLTGLLSGIGPSGAEALEAMQARGNALLSRTRLYERPTRSQPYKRPYPSPPAVVRPRQLSVTQIRTLIADPYAIYAREVLGLKPLGKLRIEHSAMLKGILLHMVVEKFVKSADLTNPEAAMNQFLELSQHTMSQTGALPFVEAIWLANLKERAEEMLKIEDDLRQATLPRNIEQRGEFYFPELDFLLVAKTDRVDQYKEDESKWRLYDYKSGRIPTPRDIERFEKQMPLQTIMAEKGAFTQGIEGTVEETMYFGIGNDIETKAVQRMNADNEDMFVQDWNKFQTLIENYEDEDLGYVSRRFSGLGMTSSDYDHFARYGEWNDSDSAHLEYVSDE